MVHRLKTDLTSCVGIIENYQNKHNEMKAAFDRGDIETANRLDKELEDLYTDFCLYSADIKTILGV